MLIILIPLTMAWIFLIMQIISQRFGRHIADAPESKGFRFWLWNYQNAFLAFKYVFAVILSLSFICMGVNHLDLASLPAQRAVIQYTLNHARMSKYKIMENAAITNTVVKFNKELASIKYWNSNIWTGWFYPDRAADLAYIQ